MMNKFKTAISCIAFTALLIRPNLISIIVMLILLLCLLIWVSKSKADVLATQTGKGWMFIALTLLEIVVAVDFYEQWYYSSAVKKIFSLLNLSVECGLGLVLFLVVVAAMPFALFFCQEVRSYIKRFAVNTIPNDITIIRKTTTDILAMKKGMIVIFLILSVAMISVFQADYSYRDDLTRVVSGYKRWEDFGRFGSNFLSTLIHAGTYLTDVSPLPQLVAVAILSIAAVLTIYYFRNDIKIQFWDICAIIPLVLSPFMLQCLSYKYDSPYMAMAVLLSIVPFLLRRNDIRLYSLVSIVCIVLMCTFYQSASGIYIVYVIFLALKDWNDRTVELKKTIHFIIASAISFSVGVLFFQFAIMPFSSDFKYRDVETFGISELLGGVIQNIYGYFQTLISSLKLEWICIAALLFLLFPLGMMRRTKQNKMASFFVSILAVVLAGVLSYGVYLIIVQPTFEFRSLIGFGALLSVIILMNTPRESSIRYSHIAAVLLCGMFVVFSFSYGNALNNQEEYVDHKFTCLAEDISKLESVKTEDNITIYFEGSVGTSPALTNMPDNYNVLRKMIIADSWQYTKFVCYYGINNLSLSSDESFPEKTLFEEVCSTAYYSIFIYDDYILVEMK